MTAHQISDEELRDVEVPLQFREEVMPFLKTNIDLFDSEDNGLGRTDTKNEI